MVYIKKAQQFNPDDFALAISEGLKDVSRHPNIKKYTPHEKQFVFHTSTAKKKLYIGGNRSGKTTGGVTEAIWRATNTHPYRPDLNSLGPTRGRVIAVDFVQGVEKIIFPQYQQWLYPSALRGGSWETAYDKATRTLNFSNKSTIEFMSYDQDLVKFAGTSRHWVHFDEEPPHSIYIENLARLIDTDGEFWITMTPVEGMTWIHEDLYEDNVNNPDGDVLVVEINTLENPFLGQSAIESFVKSIDEDEAVARIQGKFVQQGGRVYKNFDPTTGAVHVLPERIDDPKSYFRNWLWICSLDHGFNNPTAVLWTVVDKNGFAVTFNEHYHKDWTVDQHAKRILEIEKLHGRPSDIYVADPSISQRNGITGSNIQQEYQKYGLSFILGNNDVAAGLIRVKKYLNTHKYVGHRQHPLFVVDDKPEINAFPMLRITPNCSNLIWEMKKYRWKTYSNKKMAYENNAYDMPHKKDDHAVDSLRYAIMSQPDLFAGEPDERSAGGSEFGTRVNSAVEALMGAGSSLSVVDQFDRSIAQPSELKNSGWTEENSPMSGDGGWETDEHMGGLF